MRFGLFQNRLRFIEIGHVQSGKIGFQGRRIVFRRLRIHRAGCEFELDRRLFLQVQQDMQQRKAIFATGQAEQAIRSPARIMA